MEKTWQFLLKINIYSPYNPTIPLRILTLKKWRHTKICTWMFITTLFINGPNWGEKMSLNEWINKLWYIQTTEYHSGGRKKRNQLLTHVTWKGLRAIMLNERGQSQKVTGSLIPFLCHPEDQWWWRTDQYLLAVWVGEDATKKREQEEAFWSDGIILYPDCDNGYTNTYVGWNSENCTQRLILWCNHF